MRKFDFKNTKIRVTPEQSKLVQELAFENGWAWAGILVESKIKHLNESDLYFDDLIRYDSNKNYFYESENKEIKFEDLPIDIKSTSIEQSVLPLEYNKTKTKGLTFM